MKLIIQIPCLNEEDQLPGTLADLPRSVPGFDVVEWLIIDDGSTDRTVDVALANGVDHVVKLPRNVGLATAFQHGLDAALSLGADVIVNTDADNQYAGSSIPDLVAPIAAGACEIVIGDRGVAHHPEFGALKKRLQVFGSWVVSKAAGIEVPDATSGFRAYSRDAALGVTVVNPYTYTLESIIQAGRLRHAVMSVPIEVNPATRPSRLFGSTWSYVRRNALVITRVYAAYRPLRFFGTLSILFFLAGIVSFTPFLADWIINGDRSGHLQSIVLGALLTLGGVQLLSLAVVADLIASHRVVSQRTLLRVRRVELGTDASVTHLADLDLAQLEDLGVERPEVERS